MSEPGHPGTPPSSKTRSPPGKPQATVFRVAFRSARPVAMQSLPCKRFETKRLLSHSTSSRSRDRPTDRPQPVSTAASFPLCLFRQSPPLPFPPSPRSGRPRPHGRSAPRRAVRRAPGSCFPRLVASALRLPSHLRVASPRVPISVIVFVFKYGSAIGSLAAPWVHREARKVLARERAACGACLSDPLGPALAAALCRVRF